MNKRVLQAIEKRITQKALAAYLNVSPSTVRRWKKGGKAKNPPTKQIAELWQNLKTKKPTNKPSLKQKRLAELSPFPIYVGKKGDFKYNKAHLIWEIYSTKIDIIDDAIKDINQAHFAPDNLYMLNVVGINAENKIKRFSTHLALFDDLDPMYKDYSRILKSPSKKLKKVLYTEIVLKQY